MINSTKRNRLGQILSALLIICFCSGVVEGSISILPLDQVKAGMKGKGKSVFKGSKIEEFDVEILGVLRNVEPKRNIILARLKGNMLDNTGVISGMSGSPVYVGGKLIGAVAYSFGNFVKEPIAGITPIAEMMSITKDKIPKSSYSPRIPLKKYLGLDELFELNKEIFFSKSSSFSDGQTFTPMAIPLVFSGFSSQVFERAKPFFSKLGFSPVRGGPAGQSLEKISPPDLTLQEGESVAVQFVSGDLNLSAIGTVTHVDGDRVYAFGHPMYNLGSVDYAMSKAKVITVIPSLSESFKMAAADTLVGRFSQDRTSGVLGELGKVPQLIPLNVRIMNSGGDIEDFKMKVVNDKVLTPFFINISVANILLAEGRSYGDLSLEFIGDIYLENGKSVHLEDLFSGQYDTSVMNVSNMLSAVVYFLTNNEFKELGIHRIDLGVRATEEIKLSYLEKVWLDKYEASPGETIGIEVYYRTFRGESVVNKGGIPVPNLPAGSEFQLVIGDAAAMQQVEMSQYRTTGFTPRNLSQLIRMLGNLRKNNRIYFKIIASKPGLFLKGEEMPNLPPTIKTMFSSPRAAASAPKELNKSTLSEMQLPIPYVFRGSVLIPIKIKK